MKTLLQIKDKIKTIAENHRQINFYGDEKLWYVNSSGTVNYPAFWNVYESSELRKGEQGYKFTFYAIDIIQKDRENIEDIYNDTNQILTDMLAKLKWGGDADIDIKVESFIMQKIDEPFNDDVVAGHRTEITIWTDFKLNSCIIPTIK